MPSCGYAIGAIDVGRSQELGGKEIASECQTVIGVEWQQGQMAFFANAELAIIPDAGHEMFAENPEASIAAVRAYLNAPAK